MKTKPECLYLSSEEDRANGVARFSIDGKIYCYIVPECFWHIPFYTNFRKLNWCKKHGTICWPDGPKSQYSTAYFDDDHADGVDIKYSCLQCHDSLDGHLDKDGICDSCGYRISV